MKIKFPKFKFPPWPDFPQMPELPDYEEALKAAGRLQARQFWERAYLTLAAKNTNYSPAELAGLADGMLEEWHKRFVGETRWWGKLFDGGKG